jgi:hypothetical protein
MLLLHTPVARNLVLMLAGNSLDVMKLSPPIEQTRGRANVVIGLRDGPVAIHYPGRADAHIRAVSGGSRARVEPAGAVQTEDCTCCQAT